MASSEMIRLVALADLHYGRRDREEMSALVKKAGTTADVLLLCGDLTDHGRPEEADMLVRDLPAQIRSQTICVYGNHDCASDRQGALTELLEEAGLEVLDGDSTVIDGIGFAGARGFGGGFDKHSVHGFGEQVLRKFVDETVEQTRRLERALSQLEAERRVVLLHYAPIRETIEGESPEIYPFLGTSRLEGPIDNYEADIVFHGHAHRGAPTGETTGGVPVHNVSIPVRKRVSSDGSAYCVADIDSP